MKIQLEEVSKKFNRSWIFRNISYAFEAGQRYAILGGNGSGKSTLLQLIAGYISPTKGKVFYNLDGKIIRPDQFYRHITLATPYMELPEELTLKEVVLFHSRFKKPLLDTGAFLEKIELPKEKDKEIKNFSSGMRQRVKLGLSILFETDVILLDEPTTHLDAKATQWYRELVMEFSAGKCLIISSNQEVEYDFCDNRLMVEQFKV